MAEGLEKLEDMIVRAAETTATLDGRVATPVAITCAVPAVKLISRIELAGSRWGSSSEVCDESIHVRKNGAVSPVATGKRVPLLSWKRLTRPLSGPVVCSLI